MAKRTLFRGGLEARNAQVCRLLGFGQRGQGTQDRLAGNLAQLDTQQQKAKDGKPTRRKQKSDKGVFAK